MDSLNPGLSHLDENGLPKMVGVSAKPETDRRAEAEAVVTFPEEAWSKLAKDGFTTKKKEESSKWRSLPEPWP